MEPDDSVPYSTSVWAAKSSAELIGVTIRFTVRTAAKFAVYDEIKINVKNHHTLPTILPAVDLWAIDNKKNKNSQFLAVMDPKTTAGKQVSNQTSHVQTTTAVHKTGEQTNSYKLKFCEPAIAWRYCVQRLVMHNALAARCSCC